MMTLDDCDDQDHHDDGGGDIFCYLRPATNNKETIDD